MIIRPTRIDELPRLAAFLSENGMERSPEVLRWKFWDSCGAIPQPENSFVAEMDDRIVGHIGVLPTRLHIPARDGRDLHGGWFVDWVVHEAMQNCGLGVLLLRRAQKTCSALMTIQGSAQTRKILSQLNWTANRRVSVYKLNARSGAIASQAGLRRRISGEVARLLYFHPVSYKPPDGLRVREAERSTWDLIDPVIKHLSGGDTNSLCRFERSSVFLRWSFKDHPIKQYRLLIAHDVQGPVGYIIWRLSGRPDGRNDGRIVDAAITWNHSDAWRWLIGTATARIAADGALQITALAGDDTPLSRALTKNRYIQNQKLPLWCCPGASYVTDQTSFQVTFADSDIDTAAQS